MADELRPCGFCGHDEARVIVVDEVTDAGCEEATVPLYAASCPYCGARGPMALSEDEAVEAWSSATGSASTDDERREVARRLRGLRPGACFDDVYEALGAYGPSPYESRCLSATGFARHLADLIEPATADAERSASVRRTFGNEGERSGCDRDALLEQVEELEKCAWYFGLDFDEDEPLRDRLKEASECFAECARRIREALGVVA